MVYSSAGDVIRVIVPYLVNMGLYYRWADAVISRAGGTTIAELLYFNVPSLLIPFPYAVDNHQFYNAKAFLKTGQGDLVQQHDLSVKKMHQFFMKIDNTNKSMGAPNEMWKDVVGSYNQTS